MRPFSSVTKTISPAAEEGSLAADEELLPLSEKNFQRITPIPATTDFSGGGEDSGSKSHFSAIEGSSLNVLLNSVSSPLRPTHVGAGLQEGIAIFFLSLNIFEQWQDVCFTN